MKANLKLRPIDSTFTYSRSLEEDSSGDSSGEEEAEKEEEEPSYELAVKNYFNF